MAKLCKAEDQGSRELLSYYRERVHENQQEREVWFERLGALRISQEDYHKQEWGLKKRNEEVAELQKELGDCRIALLEAKDTEFRQRCAIDELQMKQEISSSTKKLPGKVAATSKVGGSRERKKKTKAQEPHSFRAEAESLRKLLPCGAEDAVRKRGRRTEGGATGARGGNAHQIR